jgi:subtilisin family serine protease
MRTRQRLSRNTRAIALGAALAGVLALAVTASAVSDEERRAAAEAWQGAFEDRMPVALGERSIVLLAAPSLADRVAAAGRSLTPKAQRRAVRDIEALQRRLIADLRRRGVQVEREHVFTRTLNGFSAELGERARAALERSPLVAGIYPVRAVYPASLSAEALTAVAPDGHGIEVPGLDGSGVTIALLDTGVDREHPSLRGRVARGIDLVDGDAIAEPERSPADPALLETHGTRMAGLLVGRPGPAGHPGVAPGARVLPIRVLGWQIGENGTAAIVGRGDVLLAGLERAVDPDGDGDVEDASQIALAAVIEPYASFADSPEARAVAGALDLGTLVVAPAGNDGPGNGRGFGTVGAPASAPAALAVGAANTRTSQSTVRLEVVVDSVLLFAARTALLGGAAPPEPVSLTLAETAIVTPDGRSLASRVRTAARSGARAVLVPGSTLPAGVLGLSEESALPVLAIPLSFARAVERAVGEGGSVTFTVAAAASAREPSSGRVAGFSSRGPTFDGSAKPDIVAPGVELATADAGGTDPRYATVTGTSAAAAVAAGAAALVAQGRPELDAAALKAVLVGGAEPLQADSSEPANGEGSGLVSPASSLGAAIAIEPASLAFGQARGPRWQAERTVSVRNLTGKTVAVSVSVLTGPDSRLEAGVAVEPASLRIRPGRSASVTLTVSLDAASGGPGTVAGMLVAQPRGALPARLSWVVTAPEPGIDLLSAVALSRPVVVPLDHRPVILSFQAGQVLEGPGGTTLEPVSRLEVELATHRGRRLGVILRLRDVLPGRYAVAVTGRGPDGRPLRPGRYVLRLRAFAADGAGGGEPATTSTVRIRVARSAG